jgi:site-specific DNA-methyltransferase (adenine-specific)
MSSPLRLSGVVQPGLVECAWVSTSRILTGDCIERMRELPDCSISAIVTDPPYEIGLMGRTWDSTGIANSVELWTEALRVLKPGGHLLAFSSTRTYHRMACAVEDAGFEIRDMIEWLYAAGMPKSKNVGLECGYESKTALGTALKPAHEPIVLARKPLAERTVTRNVLAHGTSALNVDACRVEGDKGTGNWGGKTAQRGYEGGWDGEAKPNTEQNAQGRWPANLLLSEEAAAGLNEHADNASRFFYVAPIDDPAAEHPIDFYVAKPSKRERNAGLVEGNNTHPTVKPIALMRYLIRLVCPPGGTVLDPFCGSGSTGCAAAQEECVGRFIGIDLDPHYVEIAEARMAYWATHAAA